MVENTQKAMYENDMIFCNTFISHRDLPTFKFTSN